MNEFQCYLKKNYNKIWVAICYLFINKEIKNKTAKIIVNVGSERLGGDGWPVE